MIKVFFPKDSKNFGYFLEYKLYNELSSLKIFDDIIVEDILIKQWGWMASGVDQLLIIGDYAIAIQTKWKCTRRREDLFIKNFLKSLDYTIEKSGKKLLFGLWVSRIEPFADNIEKLSSKNVHTIHCFDSIDTLVKLTKEKILSEVNK
jgi:hypothetical protein